MQKKRWLALDATAWKALAGCGAAFAFAASARLHAEAAEPGANSAYSMPVSTAKSDRLAPGPPPAATITARMEAPATIPAGVESSVTIQGSPWVSAVIAPSAPPVPPAVVPEVAGPTASGFPNATPLDTELAGAPPGLPPVTPAATPAVASPTATVSAASAAPLDIEWAGAPPGKSTASSRINATDRTIELTVPLRDGQFYLGDINARVSPSDEISLPKDRLIQMMTPLLRTAALESLKSVSDAEGYLPLAAIKEKGFDAQFDPAKVELQISPTIEQRATGELSAVDGGPRVMSENLTAPAIFAGYVNMRAGADYSSQSFFGDDGEPGARVGFDGALRWLDLVFESSATFDIQQGFSRGASRFVRDWPDMALRLSAGDISPLKTGFQGGSDLLGISVEKSYSKLQPATNIHPTGSRSFRIERPSEVDVMMNGLVTQRLHLRPGDYDLKDLPLTAGANDITLVIEDDLGQKRKLEFSVFSSRTLLAPGISEWALTAGVASRFDAGGQPDVGNLFANVAYDLDSPVVTGFYARGLTADFTANVHLQADPNSVMGGAGGALQTSFGFWGVDAAASQSFEHGLGYAANIGYELANIQGNDGFRRTVRLAADYRSEDFAPVSVDDPRNDTMLSLSAMYAQDLPWELSGSVSGIYSLGRGDEADRYGIDFALGGNFGPSLSAGVSFGYELSTGGGDGEGSEIDRPDGFKAAIRVGYRLNEKSSIEAAFDAGDGRSGLSYRHQEGSGTGVGSWNAELDLEHTPAGKSEEADALGVNGSVGYIANRAELGFSQHTGLAGLDTGKIDQRTSVTAGTAVAFADGRFAVGRPISSGFAIVGTHTNLPDSDVAIGAPDEDKRASSDFLGPALVSDFSPYMPARVPYGVSNLPVGYDLGAGVFDLFPAYKSGYRLTIGSDYTITAYGAMANAEGEPIPLLTGTGYEDGHPDDHKITVFTNRVGRFAAQGLRPGRWFIDMATEPPTRFVIDVPKDTVGLLNLDTLKPTGPVP